MMREKDDEINRLQMKIDGMEKDYERIVDVSFKITSLNKSLVVSAFRKDYFIEPRKKSCFLTVPELS